MAAVTTIHKIAVQPELTTIRTVSANDAALPATKAGGINCSEFDEIVVVVTLLNSCTAANVNAHFWSDAKNGTPNGGFIGEVTTQTIAATATVGQKVIRVAHHDSVFLEVTGITGGAGERVRIEVAGIPVYNRMG